MSDQLTEVDVLAENALICEKLLGFKKHCDEPDCTFWRTADGSRIWGRHCFDNWDEAGLILESLGKRAEFPRIGQRPSDLHWYCALKGGVTAVRDTGPLAIRAAALEYIRSRR